MMSTWRCAARVGLRTGFVEREGRGRMPLSPAPDLQAADLEELAELLVERLTKRLRPAR